MAALGFCKTCSGWVSSEAETCPHCGQPQPYYHNNSGNDNLKVGMVIEGQITRIVDFGAFVKFKYGSEGLIHISQISDKRIRKVTEELNVGEVVKVKVLEIDTTGKIRLSMKGLR